VQNIGDRVNVDQERLFVQSIQLLSTTFRSVHNKIVVMPNALLMTKSITNITRSKEPVFELVLYLDFLTPVEKLTRLRESILAFLVSDSSCLFRCRQLASFASFNWFVRLQCSDYPRARVEASAEHVHQRHAAAEPHRSGEGHWPRLVSACRVQWTLRARLLCVCRASGSST
jgi:hypothetical protein